MKYLYTALLFFIVNSQHVLANTGKWGIDTTTVFKEGEGVPKYIGGIDAFNRYLEENIKWPDLLYQYLYESKSRDHTIQVSFVVEKDGSLGDIKAVKDLGYGSFEEITRVLKASPKWKPGVQEGKKVRVHFTLPINIPPPPVSSIEIKEPLGSLSTPFARYRDKQNLPAILISVGKSMLSHQLNNCQVDSFFVEDERIALSDRFSILQYLKEGIPVDSLKSLTGRVALQIIVDTAGTACIRSYQNNLNTDFKEYYFDKALAKRNQWSLLPLKSGEKKAVSVIVAITFTADKIIYQHFSSNFTTGNLKEIERSEAGKLSRY